MADTKMTEREIEALIANQLKAWLMNEPAWSPDVNGTEALAAYTKDRSKAGAQHISQNWQTAEICHDYLAEKGKLR